MAASGEEGLHTLRLLDELYRSARRVDTASALGPAEAATGAGLAASVAVRG
ncbi:hypothetical protein B7755_001335 [Streptomyces sp. NBS 14/10]|uniref:hypothetical protein n=1 Tax=Streptomyces sp. NBS 14/10 TaxID=1945643 RepID=UPI0015C610A3|nr:hypothetical protein [Streptomyces sp. NBS 14/10]KAK1176950.1 hypothetical protein B7755_001335 [Streptomyces sp. NBS 14/10]